MPSFDHKEMFETLVVSEGVGVRYKNESRRMRFIGKAMFWNNEFMTDLTTTLGGTVYFPSRQWVEADYYGAWRILCHEIVHIEDERALGKFRWWFSVQYALPQALAVLALLSYPLQTWWPLLFLLCLAPLPAPWRMKIEMRGYAMTMAVHFWYGKTGISQELKANVAENFTGSRYYWMWPFKSAVDREVGRWSKMILCDEVFDQGPVFGRVQKMIQTRVGN